MKSKRIRLLIVVSIAMLIAIPNAKAISIPAPPPEMLKIDSAVVIQKKDAAYKRAARERKRVTALMREVVEQQKFQFDAQYVRYRTAYEESNFYIQCYGGRIFCGDPYERTNDPSKSEFKHNNMWERGGKPNKVLSKQISINNYQSYNVTSTNFEIDNFREEISNVLTFDVIIQATSNLNGRDYFEQKLICSFNILDGRMAVRLLYFNQKSQEYEHGAEYYGWLVTLR